LKVRSPRKKFITGEPVQTKYLMLLLFSMIVPVIIVGSCLYFLIFNLMAEQIAIPEYVASNLYPVINKINLMLLVGFPLVVVLLFAWGVILSHRFAGPLERIKKEIENVIKSGDYTKRLHLRKRDEIKPIADSINRLLDKVSKG
jgi:methyl-accepting chemotaxis protein